MDNGMKVKCLLSSELRSKKVIQWSDTFGNPFYCIWNTYKAANEKRVKECQKWKTYVMRGIKNAHET